MTGSMYLQRSGKVVSAYPMCSRGSFVIWLQFPVLSVSNDSSLSLKIIILAQTFPSLSYYVPLTTPLECEIADLRCILFSDVDTTVECGCSPLFYTSLKLFFTAQYTVAHWGGHTRHSYHSKIEGVHIFIRSYCMLISSKSVSTILEMILKCSNLCKTVSESVEIMLLQQGAVRCLEKNTGRSCSPLTQTLWLPMAITGMVSFPLLFERAVPALVSDNRLRYSHAMSARRHKVSPGTDGEHFQRHSIQEFSVADFSSHPLNW